MLVFERVLFRVEVPRCLGYLTGAFMQLATLRHVLVTHKISFIQNKMK